MQSTEWRSIPGYEGSYEASSDGRVRSVERVVIDQNKKRRRVFKSVILRQFVDKGGYLVLGLNVDGKSKRSKAHRLVAAAFHGEPPPSADACHNNGRRDDNRAENIRWDSRSGNLLDRTLHGTHYQSAKTHCDFGHEFSPDNTKITVKGFRQCMECSRRRSRESRARRKARTTLGQPQ